MSGGKAKKRKQQAWRKRYASAAIRRLATPCMNCGERGPHFIPPSLGEPGFFMCEKKEA